MPWDFKLRPELPNSQIDIYYFQSPHIQILEDFRATVVKVIDGDTIRLRWSERDFDFPLRFLDTNAPEMNEKGGKESKKWLENIILDQFVDILIDPQQRVGKWGRILGKVFFKGMDINEESIRSGHATSFENRREGQIPPIESWF